MRITTSAVVEGSGHSVTANLFLNVKAENTIPVSTVDQRAHAEAMRYARAVATLTGYDMEARGMENTGIRSVNGTTWSYDYFFKIVAA